MINICFIYYLRRDPKPNIVIRKNCINISLVFIAGFNCQTFILELKIISFAKSFDIYCSKVFKLVWFLTRNDSVAWPSSLYT